MATGLSIRVVDPDDDYIGIEIRAVADRFVGTTQIYAGLDELGADQTAWQFRLQAVAHQLQRMTAMLATHERAEVKHRLAICEL